MSASHTLQLAPGTQLGPYVVLAPLGAGGMGEVYLARDPRLEREVALKVLPAEFARDHDRMMRFRREALALAAINHPNIATVYGFEESEPGQFVLVLERVEGQTLAERLRQGGLPVTEALQVGVHIAEALEAAHARGVIHRDLKPRNVMLGPRGLVKVLDFGLARSKTRASATISHSITRSSAAPEEPLSSSGLHDTAAAAESRAGDSSGTPGYMSPEQVRADLQDERTDIFSFGSVLYECLAGRPAFDGESRKQVLESVLNHAPDWKRLPIQVPTRIRDLLARCLEKDVARRVGAIRDARVEIEEVLGIRRASALRTGEALPTRAGNLPRQPTHFVGREKALEECRRLLGATRLLTLTGVGGSGKTRLALRLAESVAEEFPDGTWFVDLASVSDPERVPQAAARAIGVREETGSTFAESLTRHLANHRALLLLDNCEHLLSASAELAERLLDGTPDLRLVATSREGLGLRGEQTYPVPSLSVPHSDRAPNRDDAAASEAVSLFVDRAVLVRPDFTLTDQNAPVVAEVCRRLDGIPLAIELAAARVQMLSVEQIRSKLHDRFRLLAGGSRAALPRHQTLRAAIQWSYDHLTTEEQDIFRSLSVFAGGWTLEAAGGSADHTRDEFEVLDLLTRLADKSLVVVERLDRGGPRYRFLETVRQYGRDLLIERGEADGMRRRHRDWFLALAEEASPHFVGPDQAAWLDRLETENDNIRAALDWCIEDDPDAQTGLRMVRAVQWLWAIRGYLMEGRGWIAAILRKPLPSGPTDTVAAALQVAGNLAFRQDDYTAARGFYERALAMREQLDDSRGAGGSLASLGNVAQYQGRYAEARALFERSLAINREIGYRLFEAANLICLGNVSRLLGEFEPSRAFLDQAVDIQREIGNRIGEAQSLDGLASLMLETGDAARAKALFEQALEIERQVGSVHDQSVTLSNLGLVAQRQNQHGLARSFYVDALRMGRAEGGRRQVATGMERLASLAAHEARSERAVRLWAAADAMRRTIGAPMDPGYSAEHQRSLEGARSNLGEAAFAAAWSLGSEMTFDRAIDEAIG